MTNPMRRTLPAVVAGALGLGAVAVWADTPANPSNPTIASAVEQAAPSSKYLAAGGGTAGFIEGKGFQIAQGDAFSLIITPGIQVRGVADWVKDGKHGGDSNSTDTGFEITRMRLGLSGTVFTDKLTYEVQWDAGDIAGGMTLLDAVIGYKAADQMTIFAGQFKDVITHEGLVSPFEQVAVARSLANELLGTPDGTAGRVQGAGIKFDFGQARATVAVTDGAASANTNFQNAGANWGVSARVEMLAAGSWDEYMTMSARGTKDTLFALGAGVDYSEFDNLQAIGFGVDGQFEAAGLAIYGGFLGRWTHPRNTGDDSNSLDWGLVGQVAYAFPGTAFEVYGRADLVRFENDQANGKKMSYEIGGGMNYYLSEKSNGAKFSVDVVWLPQGTGAGHAYQDILGGTDKNEIVVRAQLQLHP